MLWAFVIKTLASDMRDIPPVHVNNDKYLGPGQTLRDLGDQSHHYSDVVDFPAAIEHALSCRLAFKRTRSLSISHARLGVFDNAVRHGLNLMTF